MDQFNFQIVAKSSDSSARAGIIHTAHGDILTPAFVPVGTQAAVKSLDSGDLHKIGTQVFFVNTYHVYLRPGYEIIHKLGGLHQFMKWDKSLMTDSAGFQIFSLAREKRQNKTLKFEGREGSVPLVSISDEGVKFRSHLDGSEHFFTPEKSISVQIALGADIMIAFDECAPYPVTEEYARKAMERTHRWAFRCLNQFEKEKNKNFFQTLYGVVQGSVFANLRKQSAKYISSLPFSGIAIGGVAVGESKQEMKNVLDWTMPYFPSGKPRHLLGVGEIDDIFFAVERGIDSLDCVMPTRVARMGFALVKNKKSGFFLDINKSIYAQDDRSLEKNCHCLVCQNYSRAYLHHLFRAKELSAYRLLSYHNLCFVEDLLFQIREAVKNDNLAKLHKEWL